MRVIQAVQMVSFDSMPEDMQDILQQFAQNERYKWPVSWPDLPIQSYAVEPLYEVVRKWPLDDADDRGRPHIEDMKKEASLPPIVVSASKGIVDGRHRVIAAHEQGKSTILGINLDLWFQGLSK